MLRLHRYFAALGARHVAAWSLATFAIWAAVDLGDRTWPLLAWPLRWPTALAQTLPFAALAGSVHALLSLSASREWEAARTVGLGSGGLLRSLVLVPALLAVGLVVFAESVQPVAAARWASVGRGPLPGAAEAPRSSQWTVRGRAIARAGSHPVVVRFGEAPTIEPALGPVAPPRLWPSPSALGPQALANVAAAIERTGHDPSPYRAEAWFRPVFASTALAVPWIALPIALALLRKSALLAAASAAAIAFACYAVLFVGVHAARAGASAPRAALGVVLCWAISGVCARVLSR